MLRELSTNWLNSSGTGYVGREPGFVFRYGFGTAYRRASASAWRTTTRLQSASSSSASTAARLERMPRPISERRDMMMMVRSKGSIKTKWGSPFGSSGYGSSAAVMGKRESARSPVEEM